MPDYPELRPATPTDASAIAACVRAAYGKYSERMKRKPAPMLSDYAALIDAGEVWLAEHSGHVVGVLVMRRQGQALFVENIAVHPRAQGQGLGRRLMAFVEQQARAWQLAEVTLYTNEAMTENLVFYERLGFSETDRRLEDGYRRVYLRKPVSARA